MTDINASDMTREQHIEQGLKLLAQAKNVNLSAETGTRLAALAQAHLLAAQLMPMSMITRMTGGQQAAKGAGETLTLFMVAKRDKTGDLWISFDGERWQMVDGAPEWMLPPVYGPYIDVTIVPLTS